MAERRFLGATACRMPPMTSIFLSCLDQRPFAAHDSALHDHIPAKVEQ
jgi:hypothetical protein